MFRLTTGLTKLAIRNDISNVQIVRWRRKPRWLPTARSKLFRIPPRTVIPEDEKVELKRINNNYNNHIKSIRRYLVTKYAAINLKQENLDDQLKLFEEDFQRCKRINDEWNATIKVEREKFFADELQRDLAVAKERVLLAQEKKEIELQEAEALVREQKQFAKEFITPENIDVAIEHAIANEVDYNYAIDLDGNKLHGRNTSPDEEKQKQALKQ